MRFKFETLFNSVLNLKSTIEQCFKLNLLNSVFLILKKLLNSVLNLTYRTVFFKFKTLFDMLSLKHC